MALSKLQFNSINVTPAAGEGIRFNSGANGFETASAGGSLALIKTTTLSSAAGSISFVNGASDVVLDSTYKEYIFYFNNIHPATDSTVFKFQTSIDTGSSYGVTVTNSLFKTRHAEDGSLGDLNYDGDDLAQATSDIHLSLSIGADGDQANSGYLHLFDPSNTTSIKNYQTRMSTIEHRDRSIDVFSGGCFNTTSAIDAIIFRMDSGNIDAGSISMYGVL